MPMTDERLAEIERLLAVARSGHTVEAFLSDDKLLQAMPELVAEVKRLRQKEDEMTHKHYFTLPDEKLAEVVAAVQRALPTIPADAIRDFILDDWAEGEEHQRWLDKAGVTEIADWVIVGGVKRDKGD